MDIQSGYYEAGIVLFWLLFAYLFMDKFLFRGGLGEICFGKMRRRMAKALRGIAGWFDPVKEEQKKRCRRTKGKTEKKEVVVGPRLQDTPAPSKSTDPVEKEEPVEETDGGDMLNVVLAFEAHDLKRLSQSAFDAYLVNDSNYYLYFTFLTKDDDGQSWTTRYAGVVEPNFQLLLAEISQRDLPDIDRIAVQFIAFKRDKTFEFKAPVSYESRFDGSKFARLHCFHSNVYFDSPVIAYEIVKDDVPQRGAVAIEGMVSEPKAIATETRPKAKPVKKHHTSVKAQKHSDPSVFDLHID